MEVGRAIFRAIADFSRVREEARRTSNDLDRMSKIGSTASNLAGSGLVKGLLAGMKKLAVAAPAIGAIGAAGLAAVAGVSSLTGSLGALAGAGAPVVGIFAAVKAASTALGWALADAKNHIGDLQPAWDAMKQSVSSNFWHGAAQPIREMAQKTLPIMRDGLENIGTSWGKVAGEAATALGEMSGDGRMAQFFESTRESVLMLKPAMRPAIDMMLTLGAFGSRQLPFLTSGLTKMADAANQWVQNAEKTGKLQSMWDSAVAAFKDLVQIGGAVSGILQAISKAAQASGATSTLSTLADGLSRVSLMMNAPGFQTALTTVFAGARAGAEGLMSALGPIGRMFEAIAPQLGEFLRLGGQIAGTVLSAIADALANPMLMTGLNAFMSGLLIGVQALAPVLPVLAGALGQLMMALAPVIAVLAPSLVTTITLLATAFAGVVTALSPFLTIIAGMLPVLIPLGLAFMALYKGLLLFQQIKTIVALIRSITAVQWLWNAAMAANPIGLVIIAIAALVAGLIWFFTQTEMGKQMWASFCSFMQTAIEGFLNWWNGTFMPWITSVFAAIGQALAGFVSNWNNNWNQVWAFLQQVGANIFAFVGSIPGRIMGLLSALGALAGLAWGWFMGLVNSAMSAGGQLLSFVAGIPGQVLGALGHLGGLLVGAGQSLIQGFIDGISGMIGAVQGAVGGIMDTIAGFFPHSPAKEGAFSGKGWTPHRGKTVMTGFAQGIRAGQQSGVDAAADATLAVSNQLNMAPRLDPARALGAPAVAPGGGAALAAVKPQPVNAAGGGDRNLNVTVNNPAPEPPSQSIQKTYSKIAHLGLDAGDEAA